MVDKYKALVAPNCKLDQHTVDIICEHIANGNYPSVACEAAGVSDETLRQWVIRAEAGEKPFLEFLAELKKAEATAEANRLAKIGQAGEKSWQANAWVLERTKPQRYGQIQRIHQTVEMSPEAKKYLQAHAESAKRLEETPVEGEYKVIPPDNTT